MKKPKKIEVTLKKDHEHAGKKHKAGEKIMVPETYKDWLRKHEVIKE